MSIRTGTLGLISFCISFLAAPAFAQKAFVEGTCKEANVSIYVERIEGTDILFVARCEQGDEDCPTVYAGSAKELCLKEQNVVVAERGAKITVGVASFLAAGPGFLTGVLGRAKDVALVTNDVTQLRQEYGNCATTEGLLQIAALNGAAKEKEACLIGDLLQRVWQLSLDNEEFDREPIIRHRKAKARPGKSASGQSDYVIDVIKNRAFEKFKALVQAPRQPNSVNDSAKNKNPDPALKTSESKKSN